MILAAPGAALGVSAGRGRATVKLGGAVGAYTATGGGGRVVAVVPVAAGRMALQRTAPGLGVACGGGVATVDAAGPSVVLGVVWGEAVARIGVRAGTVHHGLAAPGAGLLLDGARPTVVVALPGLAAGWGLAGPAGIVGDVLRAPAGRLWVSPGVVWPAGGAAAPGSVTVFNTATWAATQYDLPALGVAAGGDAVARILTTAGVLALDAAAPVPAGAIETGEMALAGGALCNLPRAFLVVQADGPLALTAAAVQGAERVPPPYPVPARAGAGERQRTVGLARGVRGQAWRLRLASAGGAWSLGSLQVQVERVGRVR